MSSIIAPHSPMLPVLPVTPIAVLATPPVLMTAEEFTSKYVHVRAELVKGIVVEYPMPGFQLGLICLNFGYCLRAYLEKNHIGRAVSNDTWVQLRQNPDTVRGGDVLYFSYERLPRGEVPAGMASVLPELVVEVRSPSDRWTDIFAKVSEYLTAGVTVVVVLDPVSTTASVYRADVLQQIFTKDQELNIPDVLPCFAAAVHRLFE